MKRHQTVVISYKQVPTLSAVLLALCVVAFSAGTANAQVVMADGGSTATINTGNTGTLGMNSWTVLGGQNQLNQQWFWYSINGGAVQAINTIGGLTVTDNGDGPLGYDVVVTYANSTLSANVEYTLSGNGASSGTADMTEKIWIDNLSGSTINNLNFYQYSNFNLLMNNNNTVNISGSPGAYQAAMQTTGGPGGTGIGEVIVSPYAINAEAGLAVPTLTDVTSGALNGNMGPVSGDVAWAFEWTASLVAGGELNISKDKGLSVSVIPEPSILAFVVLGIGALGLSLRRKQA
ncbi:MAG TPA: PEP-CTERM sorting domain-containing protein [Candidatus Limnocylindrales bacterium]|nr:PEP-CTERM sorting domain-containing protein [Candidatus Limnocylindrales bacterium]